MARDPDNSFSVLRRRLVPDENTRHRLDAALFAAGQLERALTRWGLSNLDAMRRTARWREACALPSGLSAIGEVVDHKARRVRNALLNELRREFHLTEYDFKDRILTLRRESRWINDHIPSSSALAHATQVYEAFAAHLFRGAGRPRIPRPWDTRCLHGASRDAGRGEATPEEAEKALAQGKTPPKPRPGTWAGLSLRGSLTTGDLAVHLHPSRNRARHLMIPVRVDGGEQRAREAWYLEDPDSWRKVSVVRREIRGRFVYEAHLLCAKAPYRDPARYENVPGGVVGVDLGVSTLAAVGVGADGSLNDALLIRPTPEELEQRRLVAQKHRRALRALEHSRRVTNPDAYGPDRHGRAGWGSRRRGARLTTSKAYRRQRQVLRDERRRQSEARVIRTNVTNASVVHRCGRNIFTEDVSVKAWQRTWGRSIGYFAPGELLGALAREARLAGGSLTTVPCRLGLTQTCHCGAVQKKSLSQRWHRCAACGAGYETAPVDRDLHSAYLAAFVTVSKTSLAPTLDTERARAAFSGAEAPLVAVSGDPQMRRTSKSRPRGGTSSWSRRKVSDRAGRETASDVDPDSFGRVRTHSHDRRVGKTHTARFRYEAFIAESGLQSGLLLRDG